MYTSNMKKAVHSIKPPKDFHMDIVDYEHFLAIQFYESHWRHMSDPERLRCIEYMTKIKKRENHLSVVSQSNSQLSVEAVTRFDSGANHSFGRSTKAIHGNLRTISAGLGVCVDNMTFLTLTL